MTVLTLRAKNQVTVPDDLVKRAGLKPGEPIEFMGLPDGGIGLYPYGTSGRRETLWDVASRWAKQYPEIADADLELLPRTIEEPREIEW